MGRLLYCLWEQKDSKGTTSRDLIDSDILTEWGPTIPGMILIIRRAKNWAHNSNEKIVYRAKNFRRKFIEISDMSRVGDCEALPASAGNWLSELDFGWILTEVTSPFGWLVGLGWTSAGFRPDFGPITWVF
jgi:hypothetical protein